MFRIKEIILYKGTDSKKYSFTDNTYIYGNNSVGKTAFTKVIDFVLGSSESLTHDGLDNIDGLRDNLEKSLADNDIDMVAVNHSANDNEDFSEFFVPASGSADALKCLHSCCF